MEGVLYSLYIDMKKDIGNLNNKDFNLELDPTNKLELY